jgi:hypothetical protein
MDCMYKHKEFRGKNYSREVFLSERLAPNLAEDGKNQDSLNHLTILSTYKVLVKCTIS